MREDSDWLRLAVQTAGLMLSRLDPVAGELELSDEFAVWLGCSSRIPIEDAYERVHPEDRPIVAARLQPPYVGELTSEHRLRHADGGYRWVSVRGCQPRAVATDPTSSAVIQWVTRDIQDQKAAAADLLLQAQMLEQVTDAVIAVTPDHKVTYLNRAAAVRYGVSLEDARGIALDRLYRWRWRSPEDEGAAFAALERDGTWRGENMHVTHTRQEYWVESLVHTIRSAQGEPQGLVAVIRDVSERKQAEQERLAVQARIRRMADALPQLVWTASDDGTVTYYNARASLYEGLARDDGGRWLWQPVVHPDDLAATTAAWHQAVTTGREYQCEHRLRMRDGTMRWHISRALRIASPAREWFGTATDVHELKIAEQALRERAALLRLASEAAGFGAYEYDPQTDTVHWSATLGALLGVAPTTPVTRDLAHRLVHPADRDRVPDLPARVDGTDGTLKRAEYRVVRPDGSVRWMSDTWRLTFDARRDGAMRLVGTIQDVTDRKRTELAVLESERRFRIMADETPVVIWVTDATGQLQFVNRAYRQFFGLPDAEVGSVEWQPYVHPEDGGYVEAFTAALATRTPFAAEARVRRADGQWRWMASRGTPRFGDGGEFLGFVGSTDDITDQRGQRDAARDAARQKDEFIAVLAHELRNPLAPIRTSVAVLRSLETSSAIGTRCHDVIERQTAHMSRLLDDLLDVSRLARGQMRLQRGPMMLGAALAAAIEVARPAVDAKRHTLLLDLPETPVLVDGDSARLTQVFGNLLTNAAKFTPEGGTISVGARMTANEVTVAVSDTGIGIPASMLEPVFGLFTRVPHGEGNTDGLGIGLALARRIVELHGGRLTATSDGPGCGSQFAVTLPTPPAPPLPPSRATDTAPQPERSQWQGKRVLVVDDNTDAADMLATFVTMLGGDVTTVHTGTAALDAAARCPFDVVLLDVGMPDMDGNEVCRHLRAMSGMQGARVIALTGWGQEEDRRRTSAAGFDAHLVKPVDLDVLGGLVDGPGAHPPEIA